MKISTWNDRTNELLHVIADPFLQDHSKTCLDEEIQPEFFLNESDNKVDAFLKSTIIKSMDSCIFLPPAIRERQKRKPEEDLQNELKAKLRRSVASLHDTKREPIVPSLKTQDQIEEEQMQQFLSSEMSQLEILSMPEHYPVKTQSVCSLTELYYLTQTLASSKLLPGSHKALTTGNYELALLEGKVAVLYSRIEELKRQGKWSSRQPKRYHDPFTYKSRLNKSKHAWDYLLEEASWMAEDFREGNKFKKYCCVIIADAVNAYWKLGKEATCVKRKAVPLVSENIEVIVKDDANASTNASVNVSAIEATNHTVDPRSLLESKVDESEEYAAKTASDVFSSVFAKNNSSVFVSLEEMNKHTKSIIKTIPNHVALEINNKSNKSKSIEPYEPPLTAVSKLFLPFEKDQGWHKIVLRTSSNERMKTSKTPEYQKGVFGSQAHRKFHYLKPPKPPLLANIELRSPTIWLPEDDKRLIHYVAEFCFNWDLIAEHVQVGSFAPSLSKYESNIERRTPWQCFERYIQLNQKFQFSDMKGSYAFHAQQWLEQAHKTQLTTKRRVSPLGVGSDSMQRGHRKLRWASMFDAMRKAMKKREIALAKMNHRRGTTDMQQNVQPGAVVNGDKRANTSKTPTPAELSNLKYERDKSIQQSSRTRLMAAVAQQQQQQQQQHQQQQRQLQQQRQQQQLIKTLSSTC